MSDSSRQPSDDVPSKQVVDGWLSAVHAELDARESLCKAIAEHAGSVGLDCDWQFVNRHLKWFRMWHNGLLATGYLMGRTGVKRKIISIEHWSN